MCPYDKGGRHLSVCSTDGPTEPLMNRLHLALTGRRGGGAAAALNLELSLTRSAAEPAENVRKAHAFYIKACHVLGKTCSVKPPFTHDTPNILESASVNGNVALFFTGLRAPKCPDRLAGITLLRLLYRHPSSCCCTH